MPGTYTKLLYHIVFSTKGRRAMLKPDIQPRVFEYLGGLVRGEGGTAIQIGGMPDHVHMLVRWRADESIAWLMRQVKSNASRWIHETFDDMKAFQWQEGYAAFTVSESQVSVVRAYIINQEAHHKGKSFEQELIAMLNAHGIEYDPKYLLG